MTGAKGQVNVGRAFDKIDGELLGRPINLNDAQRILRGVVYDKKHKKVSDRKRAVNDFVVSDDKRAARIFSLLDGCQVETDLLNEVCNAGGKASELCKHAMLQGARKTLEELIGCETDSEKRSPNVDEFIEENPTRVFSAFSLLLESGTDEDCKLLDSIYDASDATRFLVWQMISGTGQPCPSRAEREEPSIHV